MGYERHHAIVVSARTAGQIDAAHAEALRVFDDRVSGIMASPVNGVRSFFIPPDGSKEGWPESETGDQQREEFVAWLDAQRYGDGSSPYKWVEVQYGDDDRETKVCRSDAH